MLPIYFLIILIFLPIKMIAAVSSPVLMYGAKLQQRPVFPTMTQQEFAEMMQKLKDKYTFVVYLENKLEARGFSCKSITPEECFGDFPEGLNYYTFYGSVDEPFKALVPIFKETKEIFINEGGKLINFSCEDNIGDVLNIVQSEVPVNREKTLLALRVESMRGISNKIKECQNEPLFFFIATPTADIVIKGDGDIKKLEVKSMSTTIKDGMIIVNVATKSHKMFQENDGDTKNVTFKIKEKPGYYTTVDAVYDGALFKGKKLIWPKRFKPKTFRMTLKNNNRLLRVNSLRLEQFRDDVFDFSDDLKVEDELDWNTCIYVTPGIIMGLFVTAILGSILYWGITMIMDIKTNDRFDNPNMKALVFTEGDN